MLNIFLFNNFLEKTVFLEKNYENPFWGHFDDFLGKGGALLQKLTYVFLLQIRY